MAVGGQYGEDRFLEKFFRGIPKGFLVDVGAADGRDNSNSFRLLQHRRWRGILIEPEPKQFQALQNRYRGRPDVVCMNYGVGGVEGERVLHCAAQVSTFLPAWRDRCIESYGLEYEDVSVMVKPLTKILQELKAPSRIDFLTIDCEGMDLEVLQSLDFELYHPRLICMEGKGLSISGYKEIYSTLGNVFFQEIR